MKAQVNEFEAQIRALEDAVVEAQKHVAAADEAIAAHRRSTRQASAQRKRCAVEKEQLLKATDRSQPLVVELSLDERRMVLPPSDSSLTRYTGAARTPKSGRVCMFVGGLAVLTWDVLAPSKVPE